MITITTINVSPKHDNSNNHCLNF